MAVAGSWRIYGAVTGLPSGTRGVDVSIPVSTGVDYTVTASFPTGFTALTVPTGSVAALIIPPAANTNGITLKGVTGDTGIAISKTAPTCIALASGASFGLTIATAATVITVIFL
jgi:hypothetical protein